MTTANMKPKPKTDHFNARRLAQAVGMRDSIKSDGMGATEHRVLETLGRRMAHKSLSETLTEIDTCYPSVNKLAEETLFSDRTVRNALSKLIDHGYITVSKIPGHKLRRSTNQRTWDANRYHLVPKRWDEIPTRFDKQSESSVQQVISPTSAADRAVLDALDAPTATASTDEYTDCDRSQLSEYLLDKFPDHPSFHGAAAKRIIRNCIDACVVVAEGDATLCIMVLMWAFGDAEIRSAVEKSLRIGGYIRGCFPDWLRRFDDEYFAATRQDGMRFGPECEDTYIQSFFAHVNRNKEEDETLGITTDSEGLRVLRLSKLTAH